ncbi:MAG: histidinol-phosphate transaminase [gamma proteobacterium symbiont of Taylorina sp.]|nr:histidinol-phosphate transaminase [gamma proteobacterium symbiont of Taylorina sp.]
MNKYWSKLVKALNPYEPGEQPQDQQYLKLNTNENPFPPSNIVIAKIKENVTESLRLYPDPDANKLKTALADYYNINCDYIFLGNGSDEVLAFSFLSFFKNKSSISFPDITYSFYPVYCDIFEIESETFSLNDQLEIDTKNISSKTEGIIFPNPNAPTGIFLDTREIEKLLVRFPDIVVIVDEAYIDFGGKTSIPLTQKYDNLLVIQTLSKSRSLAGLRVGFAIGHPNLIQALNRVKNSFNSYPLDMLAIEGGAAAIQDKKYFTYCCNDIIESREWVRNKLISMSFNVLPSKANFLFVSHSLYDASKLYIELKKKGILVRHFNKPNINHYLRISIGKKEDMELFLKALRSIIEVYFV